MNYRHPVIFITFILGLSVSSTASAALINLGAATNYNVFVSKNFSATSSDVEGRIAAGGNVSISSYSVNVKNGTQLYSDTVASPALVAGNDLNFSNGNIAGNVYVGGAYAPSASGSITNGTVTQGGVAPINFASEFAALNQLSLDLSLLSATATAADKWSTQHFVGAGSDGLGGNTHVFNLDGSDMSFNDYLLSDVDNTDYVIFNVAGTDISTSYGNFAGSDSSLKNMADHIIFNFFEAETLAINAAMWGTILAVNADISTTWGVINGQVIANSWKGNSQLNDLPFIPPTNSPLTNSVSAPGSSIVVLLAGLGLMLGRRRSAI